MMRHDKPNFTSGRRNPDLPGHGSVEHRAARTIEP
jgi:hypothetical protein